jgi:hypothetical protein
MTQSSLSTPPRRDVRLRVLAWAASLLLAAIVVLALIGVVSGAADWMALARAGYVVALLSGSFAGLLAILRRPPAAAAGAVDHVPVSAAVRAAVHVRRRQMRRQLLVLGTVIAALLALVGLAAFVFTGDSTALAVLGAVALFTLLVFGVVGWLADRPLRQDLRAPVFVRASGAVQVVGGGQYYRAYVGEHWVPVSAWERERIPTLPWGTVAHTRHARLVLEVRDGGGRAVYKAAGYAAPDAQEGLPSAGAVPVP